MGRVNELKDFTRGQLNAALMKIGRDVGMGTAEGIQAFLRGELVVTRLPFTEGGPFSITASSEDTFESLVTAENYKGRSDFVTEERFPIRTLPLGERKIVLLPFGRDMRSEGVIVEAEKQGLERPTYEDCLRFGAQHFDPQYQFPILFLHEPVRDDSGDSRVLYLCRQGSKHNLADYGWDWDWDGGFRFAFVLK